MEEAVIEQDSRASYSITLYGRGRYSHSSLFSENGLISILLALNIVLLRDKLVIKIVIKKGGDGDRGIGGRDGEEDMIA